MANKFHRVPFTTRLIRADRERVMTLAAARRISCTQLLREAVIFYLDHQSGQLAATQQGEFARQLRASTNRICALLAKVAVDGRTNYRVLADMYNDNDRVVEYRNAAVRQIVQALTPPEKTVADSMSSAIAGSADISMPQEIILPTKENDNAARRYSPNKRPPTGILSATRKPRARGSKK